MLDGIKEAVKAQAKEDEKALDLSVEVSDEDVYEESVLDGLQAETKKIEGLHADIGFADAKCCEAETNPGLESLNALDEAMMSIAQRYDTEWGFIGTFGYEHSSAPLGDYVELGTEAFLQTISNLVKKAIQMVIDFVKAVVKMIIRLGKAMMGIKQNKPADTLKNVLELQVRVGNELNIQVPSDIAKHYSYMENNRKVKVPYSLDAIRTNIETMGKLGRVYIVPAVRGTSGLLAVLEEVIDYDWFVANILEKAVARNQGYAIGQLPSNVGRVIREEIIECKNPDIKKTFEAIASQPSIKEAVEAINALHEQWPGYYLGNFSVVAPTKGGKRRWKVTPKTAPALKPKSVVLKIPANTDYGAWFDSVKDHLTETLDILTINSGSENYEARYNKVTKNLEDIKKNMAKRLYDKLENDYISKFSGKVNDKALSKTSEMITNVFVKELTPYIVGEGGLTQEALVAFTRIQTELITNDDSALVRLGQLIKSKV